MGSCITCLLGRPSAVLVFPWVHSPGWHKLAAAVLSRFFAWLKLVMVLVVEANTMLQIEGCRHNQQTSL